MNWQTRIVDAIRTQGERKAYDLGDAIAKQYTDISRINHFVAVSEHLARNKCEYIKPYDVAQVMINRDKQMYLIMERKPGILLAELLFSDSMERTLAQQIITAYAHAVKNVLDTGIVPFDSKNLENALYQQNAYLLDYDIWELIPTKADQALFRQDFSMHITTLRRANGAPQREIVDELLLQILERSS